MSVERPVKDWIFPAAGFTGRGVVDGFSVRCLTPGTQVLKLQHSACWKQPLA